MINIYHNINKNIRNNLYKIYKKNNLIILCRKKAERRLGRGKYNYIFLFSLTSKEVSWIAPDPISNTKPIVKTIKNIKATVNPKVLT